jgi:hypothetical protein
MLITRNNFSNLFKSIKVLEPVKLVGLKFINLQLKQYYLTPVDKPIISSSLNSIIELSTEFMQYSFTEFGTGA